MPFSKTKNPLKYFQRTLAIEELISNLEIERLNYPAYKQKYGETIDDTLRQARNGDRKKIFQLIGWDKAFLADRDILRTIILADQKNDQNFLKGIASAICRRSKPKLRKHQLLLETLKKWAEQGKLNNEKEIVSYCRLLEEELSDREWPDDDPTLNLLRDEKELPKWVKRNKHLIFK